MEYSIMQRELDPTGYTSIEHKSTHLHARMHKGPCVEVL